MGRSLFKKLKGVICFYLRITSFFMLLTHLTYQLPAQRYFFDQYSVKEGLSQSKVYDLLQDEEGYVWLGTESGISRFDGTSFTNFYSEDGIAEQSVRVIFQDRDKNLWFGHNSGNITVYDGHSFRILPLSDSIKAGVTDITQDNNGQMWISTHGDGIYMFKEQIKADTAVWTLEHFKGKEVGDRVFGSLKTDKGKLFFITEAQIKQYLPDSKAFDQYHPEKLTSYFQITSMLKDSRGDFWFGTYHGGLYKMDHSKDTMIVYDSGRDGLANNWVSCLSEDRNGNIWVGTWGGGISRISDGEIKTYNQGNGLIDQKIRVIREDLEGNILIGTNEHGLLIFKGERFLHYNEEEGLTDSHVWAIYEDHKKRMWFGTNKGITILDSEQGDTQYFNQQSDMIGDQIRSIKEDHNGDVWIGSNENKVLQYLTQKNEFFYHPVLNQIIRRAKFNTMEVDHANNLWIATMDGIIFYDIDKREIDRFSQEDGLPANFITALYRGKNGKMWVGTQYKGVTTIKDGTYSTLKVSQDISPTSIIQDQAGNTWIGTSSKGVFLVQGDSLKQEYTIETGILSNHITSLNVDGFNNLYIATNKGLNKVDFPKGNIYSYTKKAGFTGIEAKDNATFVDHEGNVWFGTVKGAFKYQPKGKERRFPKPLTNIESMLVNMVETPLVPGQKFSYTDNSIIFHYNSICLSNPEAVKYQVKMEGADKDWRPVKEQTMANYSSLTHGSYIFKVKAKNHAGVWNEEPAAYHFVIRPPFYKTWWFILSVIVLGVIAIVIVVKIRERNLKREKQILEQKVAERTREISRKILDFEKKNRDIMASIGYAQRIQCAVLPPEIPFDNTFVLFRPKDIVSGDFYWMEKVDGKELIAAVDCTGHGVPGAFLSILGQNLLTKIVNEYGILRPDLILNKLNAEVLHALHQHNADGEKVVNDGMDLALISYDAGSRMLEFAGAYNPLYLLRDGTLHEYKANRFPIGRTTSVENKQFTNHKIELKKGDIAFIFSDGYADQFGGNKGKKFKSRPLKRLLEKIYPYSMKEQKKALENNLEEWQGNYEQVDDIVFIGRKF